MTYLIASEFTASFNFSETRSVDGITEMQCKPEVQNSVWNGEHTSSELFSVSHKNMQNMSKYL